ncbi:MAG: ABC transporter substrate-binding protein, partial [Magnetococcales bacterium]|nr:ABC transporter substrate-binding protein [Magnetococcales bacterium]
MLILKGLTSRLSGMSKGRQFAVIIGVALMVATVASLATWLLFFQRPAHHQWQLVVTAPLSGPEKPHGEAMVRGVELLVQQINQAGGIAKRPLVLETIDEAADPAEVSRQLQRLHGAHDLIGTVGYWSAVSARNQLPEHARLHIPAVLLSSSTRGVIPENGWGFHLLPDETSELRFLANYIRNVIGEKIVFVLHPSGEWGEGLATTWDEVYQRFGTKTLYKWSYSPQAQDLDEEMRRIVAEINEKKLFGTYLVLGDTRDSARIIATLRQAGVVRQRVVGMHALADNSFVTTFGQFWKGRGSVAAALNGMIVTTPMLYDTSGESAQSFRNAYFARFKNWPDWVSAYAHDGANLLVTTFMELVRQAPRASDEELREQLRTTLAGMNKIDTAFPGINGSLFFNDAGRAVRSVMPGLYDGDKLVAAHTQLSPIHDEGVANFLDEVTAGRALYVNDRFMYKTNVIYTGVRIEKILSLDPAANIAEIDFSLWFRWRGESDPSDVVFTNAATPMTLPAPSKEGKDGDIRYRAYRLKGKFFLNHSNASRSYGTQIAGVSFRHRLLSRNNLMYVNDLLGGNPEELTSARQAVVRDAAGIIPPTDG